MDQNRYIISIMIKKYIVLLLFMIQGLYLFATAQASDFLIYNGKKFALTVNPMEPYFNKYPEKRPRRSAASWRGYVATFEIIHNELWVIDIEKDGSEMINGKYNVSIIKECLNGKDRMKVDWYNGLLVLPQGKLIEYVHMGYASTYEYYKLIEIENGNYIKEFTLNYEQYDRYRDAQYELYKKTKNYEEVYNILNDGTMPDEILNYFIKIYKIEYMTEKLEE
jgi:hypothetical protein